jgi:polyhydroxyalkanoate synthesis repressor PhaR
MVIKKYGNRRLYDTAQSRYITLEELAEIVRGGAEVQVLDAKSGRDLTQATLAQIILESRGAAKLLPVPLLAQLIRMGDEALAEFFGRYLATALQMYQQARQGAQALAPYNPLAGLPFGAAEALARLFGGGWGGAPAPVAPPAAPPASPPAPASEDVAALRRELESLKRSLGRKRRR